MLKQFDILKYRKECFCVCACVFVFLRVDRESEGEREVTDVAVTYSYRAVLKGRNVSSFCFFFFLFFFLIFLTIYITLGYLIKNILQPKKNYVTEF